MSEAGSVEFAGRDIRYVVRRANRNRLSITVAPDLRVTVTAPVERSPSEIQRRVKRRAPWILRQLEDFQRFLPKQPPRRYVSGESHRYLGRQYRLKVHRAVSKPEVKLKGAYLHVWATTPADPNQVKALLDSWYRGHARSVFEHCVSEALARHARLGLKLNGMRIHQMKRRWGSFTPSGIVLLNPDLIKAPRACIEYVVVHELCHGVIPNHGRRFENLLTRCLPDWRERKARLEVCMT